MPAKLPEYARKHRRLHALAQHPHRRGVVPGAQFTAVNALDF
jgi:hypothetical protein